MKLFAQAASPVRGSQGTRAARFSTACLGQRLGGVGVAVQVHALQRAGGVAEEAIGDGVVGGQRQGGALGQTQQVAHRVAVLVGGQPAQRRHGGLDGAGRDRRLRPPARVAAAGGGASCPPARADPGLAGEPPPLPRLSPPGRSPTDPLQATVSSAMGNARPRAAGVITRTSVARYRRGLTNGEFPRHLPRNRFHQEMPSLGHAHGVEAARCQGGPRASGLTLEDARRCFWRMLASTPGKCGRARYTPPTRITRNASVAIRRRTIWRRRSTKLPKGCRVGISDCCGCCHMGADSTAVWVNGAAIGWDAASRAGEAV